MTASQPYPLQPYSTTSNSLWDLHNSSDDTKADFDDCFIIYHSN